MEFHTIDEFHPCVRPKGVVNWDEFKEIYIFRVVQTFWNRICFTDLELIKEEYLSNAKYVTN